MWWVTLDRIIWITPAHTKWQWAYHLKLARSKWHLVNYLFTHTTIETIFLIIKVKEETIHCFHQPLMREINILLLLLVWIPSIHINIFSHIKTKILRLEFSMVNIWCNSHQVSNTIRIKIIKATKSVNRSFTNCMTNSMARCHSFQPKINVGMFFSQFNQKTPVTKNLIHWWILATGKIKPATRYYSKTLCTQGVMVNSTSISVIEMKMLRVKLMIFSA